MTAEEGSNHLQIADFYDFDLLLASRKDAPVQLNGVGTVIIGDIPAVIYGKTTLVRWIAAEIGGFRIDADGDPVDAFRLEKARE